MTRNKRMLTTTVSPLAERQLHSMVLKDELFASKSDAVDKAIGILYYAVHHDSLGVFANETGIICR